MQQKANIIASLILIIMLCGCITIKRYPIIEKRFLPENTVIKINTNLPVAIKNISTAKEENLWCQDRAMHFFGKLYDVTETTVGVVKEGFLRKNISIDEKANKILELSVDKISCEFGWNIKPTAISTLRVRTSNGLEKEYKGTDTFQFFEQMALSIETALVHCVEQMINDKDIIDYLEQ